MFGYFNSGLCFTVGLLMIRRGCYQLEVPLRCKLCHLLVDEISAVVTNNALRNTMSSKVSFTSDDNGFRSQILEDVQFEEIGVVIHRNKEVSSGTSIFSEEHIHRNELEWINRNFVALHWWIRLGCCEPCTNATLLDDIFNLGVHSGPEEIRSC
ncbi:AAEL008477-PA [Aedes aegypti]|uniref:AAEL008477-PA n=1 Tax=Aedes aegypti TaxID=7159 RepID=Q16YP1_AEDAE|nr:AAEL008477-PA [Aedes aegypti]